MTAGDPMDLIEQFSTFGGLDSDAVGSGKPVSSYLLRSVALATNRLILKGHHGFTYVWPRKADWTTGDVSSGFSGFFTGEWQQMTPPLPVPKKSLLNQLEVSIDLKRQPSLPNPEPFRFYLETLVRPMVKQKTAADFSSTSGLGSVNRFTVPCSPGDMERLSLWMKAEPVDDLMPITNGDPAGYPDFGNVNTWLIQLPNRPVLYDRVVNGNATWNTADIANYGMYVKFTDNGSGEEIVPGRIITQHVDKNTLAIGPDLDKNELGKIYKNRGATTRLSIRRLSGFDMFGLTGRFVERSFA